MSFKDKHNVWKLFKHDRKNKTGQEVEPTLELAQHNEQFTQPEGIPQLEITVSLADVSDKGQGAVDNVSPSTETQQDKESPIVPGPSYGVQIEDEEHGQTKPSMDARPRSASVSTAFKGFGDNVRFRVKESWDSLGRSMALPLKGGRIPTTISSQQRHEFEEALSSLPPRLARRRAHSSTQTVPTLSSIEAEYTPLDTVSATSRLQIPRDLPMPPETPERPFRSRALAPEYNRANSAPVTILSTPTEDGSDPAVDNPAVDDQSLSSLTVQIQPLSDGSGEHTEMQTRDDEGNLFDIERIAAVQGSQQWFTWTLRQRQLRIGIGAIPFHEEDRQPCELCNARSIVDGVSNEEIISSVVYVCDICGGARNRNRILCEPCARRAVDDGDDPHKADHLLRRVGPKTTFSLRYSAGMLIRRPSMQNDLDPAHHRPWLDSNLAFRAMAKAETILTRLFLKPPPGLHKITVKLCVRFDKDSISSENIGAATKTIMRTTNTPYGEISVGADAQSEKKAHADMLSDPFVPINTILTPVVYKSGNYEISLSVPFIESIKVEQDDRLVIHIRSAHDTKVFKSGCPYQWRLDSVQLEEYGREIQLSTEKQIWKDERDRVNLKKSEKRAAMKRNIGYIGAAVGVGAGVKSVGNMAQGLGLASKKGE